MSFVSHYIEHTQIYESPTSFWRWSAYGTIAAVLRDNVFMKMGDSFRYPNVYIMLVADSAVQRKGLPVEISQSLVKKIANTKIISGRTSIQAVMDELGRAGTNPDTGKMEKGGAAVFFAPEMSAGIVADPASVDILTDIYDYKDSGYTERLRGRGNRDIGKIIFTLFGASNETMLKNVYDIRAVYGGLLGRTFVIKPNEFRAGRPLTRPIETGASYARILSLLREISLLKGEMLLAEDAADEYDNWYISFRNSYRNRTDTSGVAGRIHSGVIKLAMVHAADSGSLIIRKEHIDESITECLALMPNYNSFVMGSGRSTIGAVASIFLTTLIDDAGEAKNFSMTRKEVLRTKWSDIDADTLDQIVSTLEQGGVIESIAVGGEMVYRITPKALDDMKVTRKGTA